MHDILLINMGSEAINGAAVELVSDVVELDDYWTLKGELDFRQFAITKRITYPVPAILIIVLDHSSIRYILLYSANWWMYIWMVRNW